MKKYTYFVIAILALVNIVPSTASAASVYLETAQNSISVGDTAIISVKISAEGTTINTVEGNIMIGSTNKSLLVQEFSLANSAFGLWPRTPSLSVDGTVVSFVGGVPGGFNIEGATLFKIIVEGKKEGTVTISPQDFTAYANDGKGTKVPVKLTPVTLTIGPKQAGSAVRDEWQTVVTGDKISPEDFIIVLGQDPSLFDGKKFAFFSALDNQSGISHYDVSENGAPAVRSGSTYVLQDQEGDVILDVIAYDKAGNKKVATYPGPSESKFSWPLIITIVILIAIIWFVIRRSKKSKKSASSQS